MNGMNTGKMTRNIIISSDITLMEAMTIMDREKCRLLVICDGDIFKGVISIGDIQRAILKKFDFFTPVTHLTRSKVTFATTEDNIELVKSNMRKNRIEAMPIIDEDNHLVDIIEWNQLFENKVESCDKAVECPVVIMAGGKGTRLQPLTNILPKPLIPISSRTMIEEIMCRFETAGCSDFFVSVHYMADEIEEYLEKHGKSVKFIHEEVPLGTGGALGFLKELICDSFFVINCDSLIDINLSDLISYHKNNHNTVTVVSALKTVHIPYGTLDTGEDGVISRIREKPDYVYQVNTGFYVMEPQALNYVEKGKFMNVTDLFDRIIKSGGKVGAFPVSDGSWIDIGNWDEYLKAVNILSDK